MSDEDLNSSGNVNNSTVEQSRGDVANALQNPRVLASLQDRLPYDGKMQAVAHYQSLPQPVKRRVKALKKIQFSSIEVEAEFYKELHDLEMKYAAQQQQFYDRRREILAGNVEPNDDDCDWPSDEEVDEEAAVLAASLRDKVQVTNEQQTPTAVNGETAPATGDVSAAAETAAGEETGPSAPAEEAAQGISDFWLTVLKNVDLTCEMIQDHDEAILKSLIDVRTVMHGKDSEDPGFTIEFHFSPNDYFTNNVLTKQYFMRMEPDPEAPFEFEGPEIVRCKGCEITWKKGKNVTVKVVKKVQKHKGRGDKRTVTKTVQNDSFFNFFNSAEQSLEELNEDDDEAEQLLTADFEIAHFLRERVVPRAVLYFTGDALEDDDDFEEEEEEEGDDDDDDDGDDEVIDGRGRVGGRGVPAVGGGNPDGQNQECKQQ